MTQVYLVARSASVQNGTVQVTDLFPSESQRNGSIEPAAAGPIYVRQIELGVIGPYRAVVSGGSFTRAAKGLVPYLLKNIQVGAAGPAFTVAEATTAANALVTRVRAGGTLSLANINTDLASGAAGATLTANTSTGSISDLLRVLAGETYLVPAGTQIEDGGAFVPDINADSCFQSDVRHPVDGDSSWVISFEEGSIGGLVSRQIISVYNATTGALYA
jgi:hypothetical protein